MVGMTWQEAGKKVIFSLTARMLSTGAPFGTILECANFRKRKWHEKTDYYQQSSSRRSGSL
jgi:hypothetical protein